MKISIAKKRLLLRDPFTISRGTINVKRTCVLSLRMGDFVGLGEGDASPAYGEKPDKVPGKIRQALRALRGLDPADLEGMAEKLAGAFSGYASAKAAVDTAFHDLAAQRAGLSLHAFLGIAAKPMPLTSFTIGMDSPENIFRKTQRAVRRGFKILKLKLGGREDMDLIRAVRRTFGGKLQVDANGGWSPAGARKILPLLKREKIFLIEQPFPRGRLAETKAFAKTCSIPVFLDEDVHEAKDIPGLRGVCAGVNLKLMKTGGIRHALHAIHTARFHGLNVMFGCMTESSIAVTAAAHLGALCDFLDLDGNLLLSNDPYVGVRCERGGRLVLPQSPGLGVKRRVPSPSGRG